MFKKILSISCLVLGAASYFGSEYIEKQVVAGQKKIDKAQKQVDQTDKLFGMSEYTAPLGKGLKKSAQKQIDAGQKQVDYYSDLSDQLKLGGIVLMAIGLVTLPFAFRKK